MYRAVVAATFVLALIPRPGQAQRPLPLVEYAPYPAGPASPLMAVMISGDGNWTSADAAIADSLRAHGVPAIGLDARSYFETVRTPEELSADLERVTRQHLDAWGRAGIVFIGYSRGATVGPFALARWPDDLRKRLELIVLLDPEPWANFHFHLTDLVRTEHRRDDLPVLPELDKLAGPPVLCIYGAEEKESLCPALNGDRVDVRQRAGGHRIGGSSAPACMILEAVGALGFSRPEAPRGLDTRVGP